MENNDRRLTPRQERFVSEYLKDLCASQAAIRSGYSHGSYGRALLTKSHVARALEAALAAREKRTQLDQDYVIEGLLETVGRCMQRRPVMDWNRTESEFRQAQDHHGCAVWQFDAHAAIRALELLGKHLGMFATKPRATGLMAVFELIGNLSPGEAERLSELPDSELMAELGDLAVRR